jgi:hypothetical protein
MNVYRLDPIDPGHSSWKFSVEKDSVWATAASEAAARELASSRSGFDPACGETSPWKNPMVVSCALDPTITPRNAGEVVREDGSEVNY